MRAKRRLTTLAWDEAFYAARSAEPFIDLDYGYIEQKMAAALGLERYRTNVITIDTVARDVSRVDEHRALSPTELEGRPVSRVPADVSMGCRVSTFPSPLHCEHTKARRSRGR